MIAARTQTATATLGGSVGAISNSNDVRTRLEATNAITPTTQPAPASNWAHDKGVPGKIVAELMGHAKVDTTLNVYTQVLDASVRNAVGKVGDELFTIVHRPAGASELTH